MGTARGIYEFLLACSALTPVHESELRKQRGFTSQTIERFKFRSGGKYLTDKEEDFRKKFNEKDLVESGLFLRPKAGKGITINPKLLADRIIIPYLDEAGKPVHIRPHKDAFYSFGAQIYQEFNLVQNVGKVVLTEGEFKAIAGMQYGIPTIAIPGISSFSEVNFPRLVALLNKYKIKKVFILFDNEVKDDPNLPSYVENPSNRFDTLFYSYYMAKRLAKENFRTIVATFPDSWRVNGKVDFDVALVNICFFLFIL